MAARTIQSLVTATRQALQDEIVPQRYSDARLLEGFNQALAQIRKNRPDAFIKNFAGQDFNYTTTQLTQAFPLDATFVPGVISLMIGWAELSDDQYTDNGRAAALLQRFTAQLMVAGA